MAFKLTEIVLHDDTVIVPSFITVIVGPNNSGKTRFLNELYNWLRNNQNGLRIIKDVNSEMADPNAIFEQLKIKFSRTETGFELTSPRGVFASVSVSGGDTLADSVKNPLNENPPTKVDVFRDWLGAATVGLISTEDRLTAAKETSKINDNSNLLTAFYKGGVEVERSISEYTQQVFGVQIRLDDTKPGHFSIKVGVDFSEVPSRPMEAAPIMEQYFTLEQNGDGLRSFTTILLIILLASQPYILLDEPDAFLHPPQAAGLGRILAEIATPERRLLTTTHSVDYLRGVLSRTSDITIVRLSRNDAGTHANVLNAEDIAEINNSPLLNSAKVLDGLFYQGVVIVEGDSDRAFYERANRGLFPSDEIHFVNAHNKQTIRKLIDPYRKARVNFAAIVDLDLIRSSDDVHHILQATGVAVNEARIIELISVIRAEVGALSELDRYNTALSSVRNSLNDELRKEVLDPSSAAVGQEADSRLKVFKTSIDNAFNEANRWAIVKREGRTALTIAGAAAFDELDGLLRQTGIFLVPCGSLEGWLEHHGVPVTNNKPRWIINALEWLSANDPSTVHPLRDFLTAIHVKLTS